MQIVLLVFALGLSIWNTVNFFLMSREMENESDLSDTRDSGYREAFMSQANECDAMREQISALALRFAELEKKVSELPLDELAAEYKSLAAFNEGVQNIMGYGTDVPKLNKEGVKRG